jgi:hypothetical protein
MISGVFQDTNSVLRAGNDLVARNITGDWADKNVTARGIETVFGGDAGVSAA